MAGQVLAAFRELLAEQARIAKETENPKATIALFDGFMQALNLWVDLPHETDDDLDPDTIISILMKLPWLRNAVSAGLDSSSVPLDTSEPAGVLMARVAASGAHE